MVPIMIIKESMYIFVYNLGSIITIKTNMIINKNTEIILNHPFLNKLYYKLTLTNLYVTSNIILLK